MIQSIFSKHITVDRYLKFHLLGDGCPSNDGALFYRPLTYIYMSIRGNNVHVLGPLLSCTVSNSLLSLFWSPHSPLSLSSPITNSDPSLFPPPALSLSLSLILSTYLYQFDLNGMYINQNISISCIHSYIPIIDSFILIILALFGSMITSSNLLFIQPNNWFHLSDLSTHAYHSK